MNKANTDTTCEKASCSMTVQVEGMNLTCMFNFKCMCKSSEEQMPVKNMSIR